MGSASVKPVSQTAATHLNIARLENVKQSLADPIHRYNVRGRFIKLCAFWYHVWRYVLLMIRVACAAAHSCCLLVWRLHVAMTLSSCYGALKDRQLAYSSSAPNCASAPPVRLIRNLALSAAFHRPRADNAHALVWHSPSVRPHSPLVFHWLLQAVCRSSADEPPNLCER